MYKRIMVGLDASGNSNIAMDVSLAMAQKEVDARVLGCHVYASDLHRQRFGEMEPGLPTQYQTEKQLEYLRDVHEDVITSGLKMISDSYLAPLVEKGHALGLDVEGSTPEGRNYVQYLRVVKDWRPDLVVMGANGLGQVPESALGSMTERVLLSDGPNDLLIVREPFQFKNRPILVGVDGSPESFHALRKAAWLAEAFHTQVHAVAVYDPFFHGSVFSAIAKALTPEEQKKFNFSAQEKLHDDIIDDGLATIYREGLTKGVSFVEQKVRVEQHVVAGKPYPQLAHYSSVCAACLVVVGKKGLHAESSSVIGSNSLNLARICHTNVLVVSTSSGDMKMQVKADQDVVSLAWSAGAEQQISRVPPFAMSMARGAVERIARERGMTEVPEQLVLEVSEKMGRGSNGHPLLAQRVVLKKVKRLVPAFHEKMARSKIIGQTLAVGDKFLAYVVAETSPEGKVTVNESTLVEVR